MNIPNDNVRLHLDVSTGHVTKRDMELLEHDSDNRNNASMEEYTVPCCWYRYGMIVFVMDHDDLKEDHELLLKQYRDNSGYSEAFCGLIRLAWETNADMIRLDRDGMVNNNLPTFDW